MGTSEKIADKIRKGIRNNPSCAVQDNVTDSVSISVHVLRAYRFGFKEPKGFRVWGLRNLS